MGRKSRILVELNLSWPLIAHKYLTAYSSA
jgi:hypothetical protein